MNRIIIITAMCGIFALGWWARSANDAPPTPEPRIVHFHGRFDAVKFCEGDDGELSSKDGMLSVECADRRRTLMTFLGSDKLEISNWELNGSHWIDHLVVWPKPVAAE